MGLRVALCQIETIPGDIPGNVVRVREAFHRAEASGADLAVFPEAALLGYGHRDLILRDGVVEAAERALVDLSRLTERTGMIVGCPTRRSGPGRPFANTAVLMDGGSVVGTTAKRLLPTYDVFDEARWYEPASGPAVPLVFRGRRLGVLVCEDLWVRGGGESRGYARDPVGELAAAGATVLVNLSASPWHRGKGRDRRVVAADAARRTGLPTVLVNLVGGNDDVLFDGASFALDAHGHPIADATRWSEDVVVVDIDGPGADDRSGDDATDDAVLDGLVMGIRSFTRRIGFGRVHLGLSGGIDSAVVAALAVRALGADAVRGFALPSRFSSQGSIDDARDLATRLGIRFDVVGIEPGFEAATKTLDGVLGAAPFGVTEENLQSRLRGQFLMAVSNRTGSLLLSTGNKSELATGYGTLYGDLCGGLSPIADLWKTEVYALAAALNRRANVIPRSSIEKPPSAELRPGQTDQDSLPPYDVLDRILRNVVEHDRGAAELVAAGEDPATVRRLLGLLAKSEFKRRQAPTGLRVSRKAFGSGRNVPIAVSDLDWLSDEPTPPPTR
ncbi:MAG: hypothetical protein RIS21_1094 [Planctomycetota bacterium]